MRFVTLSAFALLLAGQGTRITTQCAHGLTDFQLALALNIIIGGSVGNVTAQSFVTVQDDALNTQVTHSERFWLTSC
jgi:hypothetical protein